MLFHRKAFCREDHMVLEKVEIMPTWEKRRTWVFRLFCLQGRALLLCVANLEVRTPGCSTGEEKCSQKGWISSWESNQTNTSVPVWVEYW